MFNCGCHYYQLNKDKFDLVTLPQQVSLNSINGVQEDVLLYSAYLGKVKIPVTRIGGSNVVNLDANIMVNNRQLHIKLVDAKASRLNPNQQYNIGQLKNLESTQIITDDNAYYYLLTLLASKAIFSLRNETEKVKKIDAKISPLLLNVELMNRAKTNYSGMLNNQFTDTQQNYQNMKKQFIAKLCGVDILFNMMNYFEFLYKYTGVVGVNNQDTYIGVMNIDDLDNAFWTGSFMMFGNGKKDFFPLAGADVIGHELTHGLVEGTCGLEYNAHSGALNESFADCFGTCFEFFLYDKYNNDNDKTNDIDGVPDWDIGATIDITSSGKYLRNMENPESGMVPQPSKYKGPNYANPNGSFDHGGVHINSGITNKCFYLLSQSIKQETALALYFNTLIKLTKKATFMEFRDKLMDCAQTYKTQANNALTAVGLDSNAVADVGSGQQQMPNGGGGGGGRLPGGGGQIPGMPGGGGQNPGGPQFPGMPGGGQFPGMPGGGGGGQFPGMPGGGGGGQFPGMPGGGQFPGMPGGGQFPGMPGGGQFPGMPGGGQFPGMPGGGQFPGMPGGGQFPGMPGGGQFPGMPGGGGGGQFPGMPGGGQFPGMPGGGQFPGMPGMPRGFNQQDLSRLPSVSNAHDIYNANNQITNTNETQEVLRNMSTVLNNVSIALNDMSIIINNLSKASVNTNTNNF